VNNFVVLLRGVMPYGKNKVPMAELRELLESSGYENVQTYIHTGNILLSTNQTKNKVEVAINSLIKENFGGDLVVVAIKFAAFKKIFKNYPFEEIDVKGRYITILKEMPSDELRHAFLKLVEEENAYLKDRYLMDSDIFYLGLDAKYSDTKFNNNFIERKLKVGTTTRNYNTMRKLVALIDSSQMT
jgi:uncharacterized protein (DUF1697 family)